MIVERKGEREKGKEWGGSRGGGRGREKGRIYMMKWGSKCHWISQEQYQMFEGLESSGGKYDFQLSIKIKHVTINQVWDIFRHESKCSISHALFPRRYQKRSFRNKAYVHIHIHIYIKQTQGKREAGVNQERRPDPGNQWDTRATEKKPQDNSQVPCTKKGAEKQKASGERDPGVKVEQQQQNNCYSSGSPLVA